MKKIFLPLLALITMQLAQAQNYNFSVVSAPYSSLTGSTSITNNSLWTSWSGVGGTANIGFNFVANGNLNTNMLHFDTNLVPTAVYSNQPNPNNGFIYVPLIADTSDRGIGTGTALSNISYKVEGSVGTRIFKLEWKNIGFYNEIISDNVSTDFINFQLWLYEGSNIIEYHFGPSNLSNPAESFGGDPGFGCGLYPQFDFNTGDIVGNAYALSGNGNSPTSAYTTNYEVYVTSVPSNGTVYRFSPVSPLSTSEVETQANATVFPTVVDDSFNIRLKKGDKIKLVKVYDMSGKLVFTKDKSENISMKGTSNGVYTVIVETDRGKSTTRIIKK